MGEQIESYLDSLRTKLQSASCAKIADQVLFEARVHLEESVEELEGRGLTRDAAERTAIDRFGDVESVCKWFADAHRPPTMIRAARGPMIVLASFIVLQPLIFAISIPAIGVLRVGFFNLGLIAMIAACFRARRFTLPVVAGGLGLVAIAYLAFFVVFSVPAPGQHGGYYPVSRSAVNQEVQHAKNEVAKLDRSIATFNQGAALFASETPPKDLGIFEDPNGGYRTPIYFEMAENPKLTVYVGSESTNGVFADWGEARQFWARQNAAPWEIRDHLDVSPYVYVRQAIRDRRAEQRIMNELPAMAKTPWTDRFAKLAPSALIAIYAPLVLAIFGELFGGLLRLIQEAILKKNRPKLLV